jgi:hypothetical protein
MSRPLTTAKLKASATSIWKRGGMDTLVKVARRGTVLNPSLTAGNCTTFEHVAGAPRAEIEKIVGLAKGSRLFGDADVFVVDALPQPPAVLTWRLFASSCWRCDQHAWIHSAFPLSARLGASQCLMPRRRETQPADLKLPRFRGHRHICVRGVHDVEVKTSLRP